MDAAEGRAQVTARMHQHLKVLHELRGPQVDEALIQARRRLKAWQAARLARTHAELLTHPRWAPAARFFLDDLYGAHDLHQRDEDVGRVVPKMERLLPRQALQTLERALRMDALSEALDADLADRLMQRGLLSKPDDLDEIAYAQAYRESVRDPSRMAERIEQVDLVEHIGQSLDHLTRLPMLATSLKLMKKPAELAGLAALHAFLHRGFTAFAHMKGADEFLQRIVQGEREQMQRWSA